MTRTPGRWALKCRDPAHVAAGRIDESLKPSDERRPCRELVALLPLHQMENRLRLEAFGAQDPLTGHEGIVERPEPANPEERKAAEHVGIGPGPGQLAEADLVGSVAH